LNSIILAILAVVIPVIAGFVAKELALFNGAINRLPAPIPAIIGVAISFGLAQLAQIVGFALPGDLSGLTQDVIAAILTAVAQMLVPVQAALQSARFDRKLER
jgi:hypothetical protein